MSDPQNAPSLTTPLLLEPDLRERVWGGQRLRAGAPPIGESWTVFSGSHISAGPLAGRTLGEIAAEYGAALLGAMAESGDGFPLLIKLLDTADWLSVQVHPDDEQAQRLEGASACGKAEAWHVLDAAPEAELIGGLRPGTSQEALATAIRDGGLLDLLAHRPARAGETFMLAPGTVHALGPGLLVYEVQQPSDITYRVFDWDRPRSEGRALHIAQARAVARAEGPLDPTAPQRWPDDRGARLLTTPWFNLDVVEADGGAVALTTGGATCHALTTIAGDAELRGDGWVQPLPRLSSAVVPAACGAYTIVGRGGMCRVLLATPGAAGRVR